MTFRPYNPKTDEEAVRRIWRETGWVSSDDEEKTQTYFVENQRALVAELNGTAECLVLSSLGEMRYQSDDLRLSAVTGVTTSHVARKQGFAKRLTARLIAQDVADGAEISALGIFEQGFYDLLGFGTGPYEHTLIFDPAQLKVSVRARPPERIAKDDWEAIHHSLTQRRLHHGACTLPASVVKAEMDWASTPLGLGYRDGPDGGWSHWFWGSTKGENGPYSIHFMAFQTLEQFVELLALLKNLGDQVRSVRLREPAGIQLQDFLTQPFRYEQLSRKGNHESGNWAKAYWQMRLCDLPACVSKTHLPGESLRFNLNLSDPITRYLQEDETVTWTGCGGEYVVTFGPQSSATPGHEANLPTLTADVGAFTRLWLGVLPASSLTLSDALSGPPDLLDNLDRLICLPRPSWGWDF